MVSRTASSRERSWTMRAIRNRYLARSFPGIAPQESSYAARAAFTARSTSFSPASATSANGSSVAGLMVGKYFFEIGARNSPPMKSPYARPE